MEQTPIDAAYLQAIGMSGDYKQTEANCEICGRYDFEPILKKGKIGKAGEYGPINIVQCRHCGHVMTNPRFEKKFYVDFYKTFYKDNVSYLGDGNPPDELIDRQQERGRRCRDFLEQTHKVNPGRMLDLGCAYGATMIPFKEHGWAIAGIDPEQASVDFGREKLGLPVVFGFAEELPYEDNSFDLVVSLGALEHVHDFDAAMMQLNRTIVPGGILFIRMRHNRPWGVIWEYYNRNHYRFFSEETHALAVLRYGFDVIDINNEQIEGRLGDRHIVCRKVSAPSLERVEGEIAKGLKDSPAALRGYLTNHLATMNADARRLLEFEKACEGDAHRMADQIVSGQFKYPLVYGYTDAAQAVRRALLEARRVLENSAESGIV